MQGRAGSLNRGVFLVWKCHNYLGHLITLQEGTTLLTLDTITSAPSTATTIPHSGSITTFQIPIGKYGGNTNVKAVSLAVLLTAVLEDGKGTDASYVSNTVSFFTSVAATKTITNVQVGGPATTGTVPNLWSLAGNVAGHGGPKDMATITIPVNGDREIFYQLSQSVTALSAVNKSIKMTASIRLLGIYI